MKPAASRKGRAALARGAGLFGCWLLLADPQSAASADLAADLAVGLLAAAAATWASLRLLPPGTGRVRPGALGRLVGRFLWQSAVAGVDIALLAFQPRPRLRPGFLSFATRIPPGPARAAFGAFTSLVPGTMPVGTDAQGRLVYHCLDIHRPVTAGLTADESLFIHALGRGAVDD